MDSRAGSASKVKLNSFDDLFGGAENGEVDSWAGQFDSFLEVQKEDVPDYVKRCWASMFGLRAIKYGMNVLLDNKEISFSVIIQQMIKGNYSGIAFSVNPGDTNKNHVRIEAVSGTGESAVGGQETPYAVVMGKEDGTIIKRTFGSQGNTFFVLCIVILLLLSMMSLIDGMSLSVAQTIMVDLNFGEIIKKIKPNHQSGVRAARIITLFLGALAAWGIQFALAGFGKSIFDFVYVFTIVQLSLIGPIVMGLVFQPRCITKMWVSIIISLILGFLFNILGNVYTISWLCDVAGTVTAVSSFAISVFLLIASRNYKKQ